jgi:hypothetical protein
MLSISIDSTQFYTQSVDNTIIIYQWNTSLSKYSLFQSLLPASFVYYVINKPAFDELVIAFANNTV